MMMGSGGLRVWMCVITRPDMHTLTHPTPTLLRGELGFIQGVHVCLSTLFRGEGVHVCWLLPVVDVGM